MRVVATYMLSIIGHHLYVQTAFNPVNLQTYDAQKCCLDRQLTRIWNSQWWAFVLSYVLTKVSRLNHTHTHTNFYTSRSDRQRDSRKIFPVITFVNCQGDQTPAIFREKSPRTNRFLYTSHTKSVNNKENLQNKKKESFFKVWAEIFPSSQNHTARKTCQLNCEEWQASARASERMCEMYKTLLLITPLVKSVKGRWVL